jgi:transcriptional regulator with XRE-family HTH domain
MPIRSRTILFKMSNQKAEVATRIKAARAEKGWKQKHLAAQVSVEPITVSRWERGATTPDFDALALVAEATGKPLSYFLADEKQRSQELSLAEAVQRIEAAVERIEAALAELRDELTSAR